MSRRVLPFLTMLSLIVLTAWPPNGLCQGHTDSPLVLSNVVPSLEGREHLPEGAKPFTPVKDTPFIEHVGVRLTEEEQEKAKALFGSPDLANVTFNPPANPDEIQTVARQGETLFAGSKRGLYSGDTTTRALTLHNSYGTGGPLATTITGLVADSKGTLWVGTPLGLSKHTVEGDWEHIQGDDGLPVEDITALAIDARDQIWIGTNRGAIQYRPYADGRQWFYRASGRYLASNNVTAVAIQPEGNSVYFQTDQGICRIDAVEMTLARKAEMIEDRLNKFHRRLGFVVESVLNDVHNPTFAYALDDANDGLWTSWHVVAMSLAYAATRDEAYKESAKRGMHAIVELQNVTGVPGLPARAIVPAAVGAPRREAAQKARSYHRREEWRPSADGKWYWRADTSSDEIDGHYFAFHAYWKYIAQHDPAESALIDKQVREMTDHIIGNGYQLFDWDGEVTTWGRWDPKTLNDTPDWYLENGLNSLQMLSFLKTAYNITGDGKYQDHYVKLIHEHGYLNNLLLEKKLFPDSKNHSDDQLGYVAWYPLLENERDSTYRPALQQAVRRHYRIIEPDKSSFFYFVSAVIEPEVNIEAAVEDLREIPTDRRMWRIENSTRDDIDWNPLPNRFGRPILDRVLPADERSWNKWNGDPYVPDGGGPGGVSPSGISPEQEGIELPLQVEYPDGAYEDDGASWLLSYWIARHHGFIVE